jgi:hypothetical protein
VSARNGFSTADLESVMREIDDARLEEDARRRRVQDRENELAAG